MCYCIEEVNAELRKQNTRLDLGSVVNNSGGLTPHMIVRTAKIDTKRRGRAVVVPVTFCPFCGERLVQLIR